MREQASLAVVLGKAEADARTGRDQRQIGTGLGDGTKIGVGQRIDDGNADAVLP